MTNRRNFLMGSAAVTSASLLGMPAIVKAQAKDTFTMMTPFGFISDFIEMMNTVSGGHFAAQNLDAKILGGQGGAQVLQQLVTGQVDVIRAGGTDVVLALAQTKVPIISIGTIYQGSTFNIISSKEKPINSAAELKGKTVGVASVGGTSDILLDLCLAKAGVSKEDVKRETTGNSPGAFQILKQGRVDCFMGSLPVVVALQAMKEDIVAWSTDKYAPTPGQCFVTTQQVIDTKPAILTRAMKALTASAKEMIDQPLKPIFERAAKDYDIPNIKNIDALVAAEKAVIDQLWLSEGKENLMRNVPKLWKSAVDALRESKIGQPSDAETLYTNKFV